VFNLYPTKNNIFKIDILNALGEKLPIIICHYPTANVNEEKQIRQESLISNYVWFD